MAERECMVLRCCWKNVARSKSSAGTMAIPCAIGRPIDAISIKHGMPFRGLSEPLVPELFDRELHLFDQQYNAATGDFDE
jgi:hypothetical protein